MGESGCGKSTLARMLLGLLAPTERRNPPRRRAGVRVRRARARATRAADLPGSVLVAQSAQARSARSSACRSTCTASARPASARARVEVMEQVGLPRGSLHNYPNQLSGGQRQRVGDRARPRDAAAARDLRRADLGARRLGAVADPQPAAGAAARARASPTSSSRHNLAVVEHIATRVAVMYLGRIVEEAGTGAAVRRAAPSVHAGAARLGAHAGAGARRTGYAARRRLSEPARPAAGLHLPSSMRARPAAVRHAGARDESRPGRPDRVPPVLGCTRRRTP